MSSAEMKSVCQIRLDTGLPCNNCKYAGQCKVNEKEGKEDGIKKKRKRRKADSNK